MKDPADSLSLLYASDPSVVPPNAVSCLDVDLPDCYLGHTVYGDGLCAEKIGKASPDAERVYYTSADGEDFYKCIFVMYLLDENVG